jgi:TatD DNase family protein
MVDILSSEMKNGEFGFVLHSFCSGQKLAHVGLDLNGLISFSGILTFKNSTELRAIVKDVPMDKMLVETDSPYLAPEPRRGNVNEPAYIKHIVWQLANITSNDPSTIGAVTTKNFLGLFTKVKIPKSKSSVLVN